MLQPGQNWRDALSRHLYLLDEVGAYGPLNTLLFGQVKSKLIIEQWDEMRRVASSIRHGTVFASLLMRKLAPYPRQNQVARALTEMGKLERMVFLLECFRNESFRRRILIGLNKGEALHANSSLGDWESCEIGRLRIDASSKLSACNYGCHCRLEHLC